MQKNTQKPAKKRKFLWFISHDILLSNATMKEINLLQLTKGPLENNLQVYYALLQEIDLLTIVIEYEEIDLLLL